MSNAAFKWQVVLYIKTLAFYDDMDFVFTILLSPLASHIYDRERKVIFYGWPNMFDIFNVTYEFLRICMTKMKRNK